MREVVFLGVAYTLLSACTFDATGETAGDADDETGMEAGTSAASLDPTAPTGAPTSTSTEPSTSSATTSGPQTGDTTTDPTDTDPTTGDPSETGDPPLDGECPEVLPDGWILCEDFEGIDDPDTHFAIWNALNDGAEDRLRVDTTQAQSGDASLRAQFDMSMWWVGAAWLRFGAGPMETPHAPEGTFDEVWVRLHLFLEDGWDVGGMGDVIEVNSVSNGFAHVMSASIDAPPGGPSLRARARTCVVGDGTMLNCDGNMDYLTMAELGNAPGSTPIFDGSASGEWHCLVLHVRLNEPGTSDGVIEMSLDGALESEIDALNLRGSRDDGINAIHLSAYWDGGAPANLSRYIDDIVVSESALDCE